MQWDTAGQERFRTITNSYYRKVQGILLVYDITERKSFDGIRSWVNQIQIHAEASVNKILVGNKFDLAQKRVSICNNLQKIVVHNNIKMYLGCLT